MSDSVRETADIETSSDGYAARFSGAVGAWMLGVQSGLTLKLLAGSGAKTVLDVGGGHGQLAQPLLEAGYEVTVLGSDASCSRRIAPLIASGALNFQTGHVVELPFEDGSFDAAISFRLLPHCERWETLIGELCRVARKTVVVDYPTSQSFNALGPLFFGAKKKLEGNTRTWRDFRHEEVRHAFESQGFRVVARRGQFFFPMALHRMLKSPALSRCLEAVASFLTLRSSLGSPVILCAESERGNECQKNTLLL
ncbi:MAG: methyltransferase domain-containing protein [Kiritimatiellae bacterium]|nr:methyltransferase domain-containing protein [Kiritimatiellia bacterium]